MFPYGKLLISRSNPPNCYYAEIECYLISDGEIQQSWPEGLLHSVDNTLKRNLEFAFSSFKLWMKNLKLGNFFEDLGHVSNSIFWKIIYLLKNKVLFFSDYSLKDFKLDLWYLNRGANAKQIIAKCFFYFYPFLENKGIGYQTVLQAFSPNLRSDLSSDA